jgi:1-acyl-sn-glycerol-3-phosphate acyltransferase
MIDGFSPNQKDAFVGYSAPVCDRVGFLVDRLAKRLHVEMVGLDQLPRGGALLVANHAFGFWDIALAVARIRSETGRRVWALGEHLWWKVPLVRRLAGAVGIVDGTPGNADALLRAGELLLVLPGGLREALKPRELRYRLLWGRRYGFVRAAMRNKAPIVPIACLGGDDLFDLVGDAFDRGRRWHVRIPIPLPAHLLPIPHRARLRFVVGEPIEVEGRGDESDMHAVRSLRREVEGALHEMIEDELTRRAHFGASLEQPSHPTSGLRAISANRAAAS